MDSDNASPQKPSAKTRRNKPRDDSSTGLALRSVYQKTVEEQIPPDMLDLLGKLD